MGEVFSLIIDGVLFFLSGAAAGFVLTWRRICRWRLSLLRARGEIDVLRASLRESEKFRERVSSKGAVLAVVTQKRSGV